MGNPPLTIEEIQEIAESRGGRCLSKTYQGVRVKLQWECAEKHKWWATPRNIKSNKSWCPICSVASRLNIEEMREIAKSRGGFCHSDTYEGSIVELLWECSEGHMWWASPSNVKYQESWCPVCCGNMKLSLDELEAIAKSLGGRCLSKEYINNYSKMKWRCRKGHEWEAPAKTIKRGH